MIQYKLVTTNMGFEQNLTKNATTSMSFGNKTQNVSMDLEQKLTTTSTQFGLSMH